MHPGSSTRTVTQPLQHAEAPGASSKSRRGMYQDLYKNHDQQGIRGSANRWGHIRRVIGPGPRPNLSTIHYPPAPGKQASVEHVRPSFQIYSKPYHES